MNPGQPEAGGLQQLTMVACDKTSIDAILAALRERAAATAPGHWVQGFLYDDGKTPRMLTRADLDAAVPDHPVVVTHRGGHTDDANSLALAAIGATRDTADKALETLQAKIPDENTRDDHRRGVELISKLYASRGITSACEADTSPDDLQAYQDARDAGTLRYRAYCLMDASFLDRYIAAGVHTGFGDSMVRIGAIKQFADGSISERTAWLAEPYVGIPNYFGVERGTRESLYEDSRKAWLAGFQLATHANGERAIDRMLGIYEQLQRESPRRDPRLRLEHCTVVTPELIARMQALSVIPVPFSGYVNFHGDVLHFYGEERARRMFAHRSLIDAGLRPPASSDYTASPPAPMRASKSMTRARSRSANSRIWPCSPPTRSCAPSRNGRPSVSKGRCSAANGFTNLECGFGPEAGVALTRRRALRMAALAARATTHWPRAYGPPEHGGHMAGLDLLTLARMAADTYGPPCWTRGLIGD